MPLHLAGASYSRIRRPAQGDAIPSSPLRHVAPEGDDAVTPSRAKALEIARSAARRRVARAVR
jgi:hypothetical protein